MGPLERWTYLFVAVFLSIILFCTHEETIFGLVGFIDGTNQVPVQLKMEIMQDGEGRIQWSTTIETPLGNMSYSQLEEEIFRPLGYRIRERTLIPALDFVQPLNCPKVFSDWLERNAAQDESAKPPKSIPSDLLDGYTLNGNIHLIEGYMDDRSGTKKGVWFKEKIDELIRKPVSVETTGYGGEGLGIYYAMRAFNVSGKNGVVVGSLSPWLEAHALKLGAKHITTVEYMHIVIPNEERIDYLHPIDIAKNIKNAKKQKAQMRLHGLAVTRLHSKRTVFGSIGTKVIMSWDTVTFTGHLGVYDFVASFSSIEHSGLGRFGDALDPIGDLREAMKIHCMLKDDGLLFIALPVGWDTLHWNLHRIYGRIRYALFAAGFDILGMYYVEGEMPITERIFARPRPKLLGDYHHPTLVLRKRKQGTV